MSAVRIETACGEIILRLRRDAAPVTCAYILRAVEQDLYTGSSFYRLFFFNIYKYSTLESIRKKNVIMYVICV